MNCAKYEPLIALYVEDDLTEAEARTVESHLEACHGCREVAAQARESQAALKVLRAEFLGDSVYQEVRGDVMRRIATLSKPSPRARYAIAAGLAIAMLAGWLWRMPPISSLESPKRAGVMPPPPLRSQAPAQHKGMARARRRPPRPAPSFKAEPLVVKIITDDPQVVIYWLVDQNGG